MGYFTTLYRDDKSNYNHVEPWDNQPVGADDSEDALDWSQMEMSEKLEFIKNEKGTKVIAKVTSRSDIVEAEMSKREEHQLSRHYVPAIISVHHTIQHAAYAEAMAEPSYCITMEGAETTAENLLLDLRRSGGLFSKEYLKSIAISLLHIHDHGLVHGDFGTHNVAKFGERWKILGIGGSIVIGQKTNPRRGFFHPPEAVVLETRNVSLGEKNVGAAVVPIDSAFTYDIWAFGTIMYEALAGLPLSPYRSAYKAKRAMTTAELFKVGQWDDRSLRKALRHIEGDADAQDLIKKLLHPNPEFRAQSMREVLGHPYFGLGLLAESPTFIKSFSPKNTEPVSLKVYSDEYMTKMGITEADLVQFLQRKAYPVVMEDPAEDEDEAPNPADDNNPVVQQETPVKDSAENLFESSPKNASFDDFVAFLSSSSKPADSNIVGNSFDITPAGRLMQLAAATSPTPVKAPNPEAPPTQKFVSPQPASISTNSAINKKPPQTLPPLSTPQSTTPQPQASTAKSTSKFSVKGLKSKFGKK